MSARPRERPEWGGAIYTDFSSGTGIRATSLSLVLLTLTLGGCGEDAPAIDWRYRLPAGLDAGEVVGGEAIILRGGCDGSEQAARFRFASGATIPTTNVEDGVYGFSLRLTNARCEVVATGCVDAIIPSDAPITTSVSLESPPVRDSACIASDASTDGGVDAPGDTAVELPFTEVPGAAPRVHWPRTGSAIGRTATTDPRELEIFWLPEPDIDLYYVEVTDDCAQARSDGCGVDAPHMGFYASGCGRLVADFCNAEVPSPLPTCDTAPVGKRYCFRVRACPSMTECTAPSDDWYVDIGRTWTDYNGDGVGDLAVGMPSSGSGGELFVTYGGDGGPADITLEGLTGYAEFGGTPTPAGDTNGDGFMDLIVAERLQQVPVVVFGSAEGLTQGNYRRGEPPVPIVPLAALGAGDQDNDGLSDQLAGYPSSPSAEGQALVWRSPSRMPFFCGDTDTTCSRVSDARGPSGETYPDTTALGTGVAGIVDIDLDGYGDVVAGAPSYGTGGALLFILTGETTPQLGTPTKHITLGVFPSSPVALGTTATMIGSATSTPGNFFLTGDPTGTPQGSTDASGLVAVAGDTLLYRQGTVVIGAINNGLPRAGETPAVGDGARFGTALVGGSLDTDERRDVAVGAPGAAGGSGLVRVYFGATDASVALTAFVDVTAPAGARGFGEALSATDMDGDGVDELYVGAPGSDSGAGRVYRCNITPPDSICAEIPRPSTATPGWGADL